MMIIISASRVGTGKGNVWPLDTGDRCMLVRDGNRFVDASGNWGMKS